MIRFLSCQCLQDFKIIIVLCQNITKSHNTATASEMICYKIYFVFSFIFRMVSSVSWVIAVALCVHTEELRDALGLVWDSVCGITLLRSVPCHNTEWMTATSVHACPQSQVSSSSEPSSGSTCCSSPEWSSTPEQCTQSYSSEGEYTSHTDSLDSMKGPPHVDPEHVIGSLCRSLECCRLSGAGEHACPDLHCGQHLRSRWNCGLSFGHSQVEPSRSRPISYQKTTDKKENDNCKASWRPEFIFQFHRH